MRRSRRFVRACAMFGLDPAERGAPPAWCAEAAAALDAALRERAVALLCGPSGAGKSATVRALVRRLRSGGRRVIVSGAPRRGERAVIDLFRCSAARAMSHLARAGLAEAGVMVRPAVCLSTGQRARLAVALAMSRAARGDTVILDEFGSTLDRPTAESLARTVRRWARETPVRIVCATAHEDVLGPLDPEVLLEFSLAGPPALHTRDARRAQKRVAA